MTTVLYTAFTNPYNTAQSGLTVEAWLASAFTHSPVGNPSAYPPAASPVATTTTAGGGTAELTGLTVGVDLYISIQDINGKPWFFNCPAAYLGNTALTARKWSFNPVVAAASTAWPAKSIRPWPAAWDNPPVDDSWYQNTLGVACIVYMTAQVNPGSTFGVVIVQSDEASHADVGGGSGNDGYGLIAGTNLVMANKVYWPITFIVPAGSYWKWTDTGYGAGGVIWLNNVSY